MLRHRITGSIAVALAAAALIASEDASAAGSHSTMIVPFHSIAGIALGMTPAAVRQRATPTDTQFNQGHLSQYGINHDLLVNFGVHDGKRRVRSMETGAREYRTAAGIGVGSTESALRRANPHLKCTPRGCDATRNHVETSFALGHGKVALIEIIADPAG